jgi:hypothetical protein
MGKTKNIFMVFRKNLARTEFRISSSFAAMKSARMKSAMRAQATEPR